MNNKRISTNLEHIQKTLNQYNSIVNSVGLQTRINNSITPALAKAIETQQKMLNSMAPYLDVIEKAQKLSINIQPQLTLISRALEPTLEMIERVNSSFNYGLFEQNLRKITEVLEAYSLKSMILGDYWIVFEGELISEIKDKMSDTGYDVTHHIIEYYTRNEHEKIKGLLDYIEERNCIPKRLPILKDCFEIVVNNPCSISCTVVIPTLTAQADGVLKEIVNIAIPQNIKHKICQTYGFSDTSTAKIADCYLKEYSTGTLDTIENFEKVIKEKAFQRCDEKSSYQKSRQAILHGGCSYSTKENLVRAWLEIIFLAKLYFELLVCNENMKGSANDTQ